MLAVRLRGRGAGRAESRPVSHLRGRDDLDFWTYLQPSYQAEYQFTVDLERFYVYPQRPLVVDERPAYEIQEADDPAAAPEILLDPRPDLADLRELLRITKLRYLVVQLLRPGKSLVVSQFWQALMAVERALTWLGVPWVSVRNKDHKDQQDRRRALAAFREGAVDVLLLSLDLGAHGLDLSCSHRVFLLEPVLDPNLEQQVVARAHRLGQERAVAVETLVLQGSVEQRILEQRGEPEAPLGPDGRSTSAPRKQFGAAHFLKAMQTIEA